MIKALSICSLQGVWSYVLKYETLYLCNGFQDAVAHYAADQTRNTWANPFSLR